MTDPIVAELYQMALTAEAESDSEFHVESVDGPCQRCARLAEIGQVLGLSAVGSAVAPTDPES